MNDLLPGTRIDQRPGEDARLAAEESVGRELLPLRQVGQLAVVGQEAHVPPDPTAAPKRPRSGGVADQLEAFHDDRLIGLLLLDRNVRRIERRRHGLAAVLRRATARARQHQLVGDEASISRAVQAAERNRSFVAYELVLDRKSTRLNSSHSQISYAVFCLKKKKKNKKITQ